MKGLSARARFRMLAGSRSGVAAVEFALLSPFMIMTAMLMLDFARAFFIRIEIVKALNAAAHFAFLNAQLVTSTTVTTFLANVQTVAQSAASLSSPPTVTALFNNASNSSNAANFYCLSSYSPVVWTSTGTASATCGGNVMSGKFVTITVTTTANTFFPSDPVFGASITVTDSAIVRFQ